jgi:pimeloyl-ACP methyl ester carboxylesterase
MKADSNLRKSLKIPRAFLVTAKILEATSPKLAARFAMKLFTTPVKFKLPKREQEMDNKSRQELLLLPILKKTINIYHLGDGDKKVLLVHGWSGRGTQLCSIAEKLVKAGFTTISFDAPAHGKSSGRTSDMTEFIESILLLQEKFGPFDYAIGHSLGAMALLNAIKKGLKVNRAAIIGSGDIIKDIMDDFIQKLGMNIATGDIMIRLFEKKFSQSINNYSAYIAAQQVTIPVLIFHDEDDADVPVSSAYHIEQNLVDAELIVTAGLGHRKILGDKNVIKKITEFLQA